MIMGFVLIIFFAFLGLIELGMAKNENNSAQLRGVHITVGLICFGIVILFGIMIFKVYALGY